MGWTAGDYIVREDAAAGHYAVCRVLAVDEEEGVTHVAVYAPVATAPKDLTNLALTDAHVPVASDVFDGWSVFANKPLDEAEMALVLDHLRRTNFSRYVAVTGQDAEAIVNKAQAFYDDARALHDEKDYEGAISQYRQAFEICPLMYEAKDNEAFCEMSMGRYDAALACFDASLRLNGHTLVADFSVGECLFKMGDYAAALPWFQASQAYGIEDEGLAETLDMYLRSIGNAGVTG